MLRKNPMDTYVAAFIDSFSDNFYEQCERLIREYGCDVITARRSAHEFSSSVAHEDAEEAVATFLKG